LCHDPGVIKNCVDDASLEIVRLLGFALFDFSAQGRGSYPVKASRFFGDNCGSLCLLGCAALRRYPWRFSAFLAENLFIAVIIIVIGVIARLSARWLFADSDRSG